MEGGVSLGIYDLNEEIFNDLSIRDYKLADFQYEILMNYIAKFEENLTENEEIALKLTSFGQSLVLNVTDIGYHNPSIITFRGYVNGQYSELIQHVSQLNFLLTSVPKQESNRPARRIGFKIADAD